MDYKFNGKFTFGECTRTFTPDTTDPHEKIRASHNVSLSRRLHMSGGFTCLRLCPWRRTNKNADLLLSFL